MSIQNQEKLQYAEDEEDKKINEGKLSDQTMLQ